MLQLIDLIIHQVMQVDDTPGGAETDKFELKVLFGPAYIVVATITSSFCKLSLSPLSSMKSIKV